MSERGKVTGAFVGGAAESETGLAVWALISQGKDLHVRQVLTKNV